MVKYDKALKEKIIKLHLSEGRSFASLEREFNLGAGSPANWVKLYRKECQTNNEKASESEQYSENLKLKKENEELKKENLFLKKAAAFFAKEVQ